MRALIAATGVVVATVLALIPPGFEVAVYCVNADPPSLDGAAKRMVAPSVVACAVNCVGALGTLLEPEAVIVNVAPEEMPPPGAGLLTVTLALATAAMSDAGTEAVSITSLMYVVGSVVPFHCTVDNGTKPLPLTVSVKAVPRAVALDGANEEAIGTGLLALIVKVDALDVAADELLTVTRAVPALATSEAGTAAVSCVLLT